MPHIPTDRLPSYYGWARFACDVGVDDERVFMVDVKIFFGKRAALCLLPLRVDEFVEKECLIRQLKSMHIHTPQADPSHLPPSHVISALPPWHSRVDITGTQRRCCI